MIFGTAAAVAGFVEQRQAASARRDLGRAVASLQGCSRHRRDDSRLPRRELVWLVCAGRHAAGRDREAQRRSPKGRADRRIPQAASSPKASSSPPARRRTSTRTFAARKPAGARSSRKTTSSPTDPKRRRQHDRQTRSTSKSQTGIATLTLNRPDKRNAMSDDMRTDSSMRWSPSPPTRRSARWC